MIHLQLIHKSQEVKDSKNKEELFKSTSISYYAFIYLLFII